MMVCITCTSFISTVCNIVYGVLPYAVKRCGGGKALSKIKIFLGFCRLVVARFLSGGGAVQRQACRCYPQRKTGCGCRLWRPAPPGFFQAAD